MSDFEDLDDCYDTISMMDDDGIEKNFFIIDVAEDSNSVQYLLVVEEDEFEEDEVEAVILKQDTDDGEDSIFSILKDELEIDRVSKLFSGSDNYEIEI